MRLDVYKRQAHDDAASFSLSMYLPHIHSLNQSLAEGHKLNVFPIKGLSRKNPIFLIYRKGTYLPNYTKVLIGLCLLYTSRCV